MIYFTRKVLRTNKHIQCTIIRIVGARIFFYVFGYLIFAFYKTHVSFFKESYDNDQ